MNSESVTRVLTIDVGNSRSKFGLFACAAAGPGPSLLPHCLQVAAVSHTAPLPWQTLADWQTAGPIDRVVLAGVNPPGLERILAEWPATWAATRHVIRDPASLPLQVSVAAPEKVGIDRLLNAVAANVLRAPGQPMIIVSAGTATTVDAITPAGDFAGGAILPGFDLGALALHQYTALLPLITSTELDDTPPAALGRNTHDAIRSGLFWGQVGAVRELIAQLTDRADPAPRVILTGGAAHRLASHFHDALHEPNLPLKGLAIVAEQWS